MPDYISVTQLLTRLGFIDYSWVPPERRLAAMTRGEAVAELTADMDRRGTADHWNPAIADYGPAWTLFKKEFNFMPIMIERELKDPVRRLKGRVDRRGRCVTKYGGLIVVEIKTGGMANWFRYQTALYEYLINVHYGRIGIYDSSPNRWAILLRPDGTYKPQRHRDPNDLRVVFKRWKEMT